MLLAKFEFIGPSGFWEEDFFRKVHVVDGDADGDADDVRRTTLDAYSSVELKSKTLFSQFVNMYPVSLQMLSTYKLQSQLI